MIAALCKRWHVMEMAVFDSVLRGDFNRASDTDMLVEFAPNRVPVLRFISMTAGLACLFGRPADVLTRSAVERSPNYNLRMEVWGLPEIIYAEC